MKHAADVVLNDLAKFDDKIAAEVRRVSSSDVDSTSIKGSARPMPMVDKAAKIAPRATDPLPAATMPMGAQKPPADWPRNPISTTSGRAVPGAIGSMPSSKAPPR
jgi:hypothetical protein